MKYRGGMAMKYRGSKIDNIKKTVNHKKGDI